MVLNQDTGDLARHHRQAITLGTALPQKWNTPRSEPGPYFGVTGYPACLAGPRYLAELINLSVT